MNTIVTPHDAVLEKREAVSRTFAGLLLGQYIIGIVLAIVVSPIAWEGAQSSFHIHLKSAIFLGLLTSFVPAVVAWRYPRSTSTMVLVSVGQMLTGALWIHLGGGRIEMHFHVFVSLSLLAMYRDWRPLLIGAAVAAVDHVLRGIFFPMSIFGVASAPWRFVEHAVWVVVQTFFLGRFTVTIGREVAEISRQRTAVEAHNRKLQENAAAMVAELERVRDHGELHRRLPAASDDTLQRLGTSVNDLLGTLEGIIGEVAATADRVAEASNQIAAAAEETSATVSHMTSEAEQTLDNAERGGREASSGATDIQQTISRLREVGESITTVAATMATLNERGREISAAVKSITDIATKTNLLSLNATIEAARAGEHGRGFAVVADEVRKLAEASRKSAEEIGQIATTMTTELGNAHEMMSSCRDLASKGVEEADTAANRLDLIVRASNGLIEQVRRIHTAANETNQASALAAEQSAHLARDSEQLRHLVNRFKLKEAAAASTHLPSPSSRRPRSAGAPRPSFPAPTSADPTVWTDA